MEQYSRPQSPLTPDSPQVAPALATGNTAVVKPSEVTSMTGWARPGRGRACPRPLIAVRCHIAFRLSQVMHEIGLPAGVCNFVYGTGAAAGSALVQHPDVPLISFTGGTVTGDRSVRWGSSGLWAKSATESAPHHPTHAVGGMLIASAC